MDINLGGALAGILPTVATIAIFCMVAKSLFQAVLKWIGMGVGLALIMAYFGMVEMEPVREGIVSLLVFMYDIAMEAFTAITAKQA